MKLINNIRLIKSIPLQIIGTYLAIDMWINLRSTECINTEPNFAWINFVIQVAIMVALSMLLAPKPKQPKKPVPVGIEQFDVPTAEEGRPIQVLFGKRFIAAPNVVWFGHLRSTPVMS